MDSYEISIISLCVWILLNGIFWASSFQAQWLSRSYLFFYRIQFSKKKKKKTQIEFSDVRQRIKLNMKAISVREFPPSDSPGIFDHHTTAATRISFSTTFHNLQNHHISYPAKDSHGK